MYIWVLFDLQIYHYISNQLHWYHIVIIYIYILHYSTIINTVSNSEGVEPPIPTSPVRIAQDASTLTSERLVAAPELTSAAEWPWMKDGRRGVVKDLGMSQNYVCYGMLWHGMVWYGMLCCVMLCSKILCYVILCCVMLCYVVLCSVLLCSVMFCYVLLCYGMVWIGMVCQVYV